MISNEEIHAELLLIKEVFDSLAARMVALETLSTRLLHQDPQVDQFGLTEKIMYGELAIGEETSDATKLQDKQ